MIYIQWSPGHHSEADNPQSAAVLCIHLHTGRHHESAAAIHPSSLLYNKHTCYASTSVRCSTYRVVVVVVTRSDQLKPPAIAIVRQNGLSSASCRASVAVTPVSRQIWWIQVVGGWPLVRLHSCKGRSPSLDLVQIRRIWFAGTSLRSLATWPNRPSLRLRTIYETSNRPVWLKTSSLDRKSCQLMCMIHRWHRTWKESNVQGGAKQSKVFYTARIIYIQKAN